MREYKLIVAGGRDYWDYERMHAVLFDVAEQAGHDTAISIVSGKSRGTKHMINYMVSLGKPVQIERY